MSESVVCCSCDRVVKANQTAIECSKCCSWVHKGCSGLSNADFNKFNTMSQRSGAHSWECQFCAKSEVKRVSLGNSDSLRSANRAAKGRGVTSTPMTQPAPEESSRNPNTNSSVGESGSSNFNMMDFNHIQQRLNELQKKNTISNKDVLFIVGKMFEMLMDQKNFVRSVLDDLVAAQQEKIIGLEREIGTIKKEISSFKLQPPNVEQHENQQVDLITEIHDRNSRSRNLIVHNIAESDSNIAAERVDFDTTAVIQVLDKLEIGTIITDIKVNRIGKVGDQPRPIRVVLQDSNMVLKCLKQKRKLGNQNVRISADLTFMQRQTLRKLYDEMNARKENGEGNLSIRYSKGVPFIHAAKNEILRQEQGAI